MKRQKKIPPQMQEPSALYRARGRGVPPLLSADQAVERIRAGLPMAEFDALQDLLGVTSDQLAEVLKISRSTLARRRLAGKLESLESDRLMRFARLFARAREVMGGETEARHWMKAPARALAFEAPLHFAGTEVGSREVENLLGRIEQGVFS